VRAAQSLGKNGTAATWLAADGPIGAAACPAAASSYRTRAEAPRDVGDVDAALQGALQALRDDLPELDAELFADALHPGSHSSTAPLLPPATRHRSSTHARHLPARF
jgi:hypothetical protein